MSELAGHYESGNSRKRILSIKLHVAIIGGKYSYEKWKIFRRKGIRKVRNEETKNIKATVIR